MRRAACATMTVIKKNSDSDGLVNYIGNLNKNVPINSVADCAPIPYKNNNINNNINYNNNDNGPINEDYNFGFEESNNNNINNNVNQYESNTNNDLDKGRNEKKVYVNNSTFHANIKDDDDDDNPYKDF